MKKNNNNKYSIPTGIFAAKREGQQSYIMTGRLGFGLINSANPKPIQTILLHYILSAFFAAIMTNRLTLFPPKHGPPNVLTQLRHKQISP